VTTGAPPRPDSRRSRVRAALPARRARLQHKADSAPLLNHLEELRTRVLLVALWLLTAVIACYSRRDDLFSILDVPLDDRWPVQTLGVTEPFFTSLSVAAQAGLVLTTPVIAWHAWRFVRPAIAPSTRRTIGALLIAAPVMFTSGVVFGYFVILGPAIQFLLGMGPDSIQVVVRANDYYSFVATTLLAVGLAFCFPLVLLGLARVGIITSALLRRSRRVAYVLLVVLAALLPTADPVSLALEVLPLIGLYELSVIAVRVQERMLLKAALRADDELAGTAA